MRLTAWIFALVGATRAAMPPPSGHACLLNTTISLPFCNMGLSIQDRVDDLISRLNITEKLGIMGSAPKTDMCATLDLGVPRLGIPPLQYLVEMNSGVSSTCYVPIPGDPSSGSCPTIFPSSLNLGASFNRSLWRGKGNVVGTEARVLNNLNVPRKTGQNYYVNLFGYGPDINNIVDPRNGRNGELVSEDPFLTGEYAAQVVAGMQGGEDSARYIKCSSHLKHYTAYNVETSRMAGNALLSQRDLWESYMPQYAAGFSAGASGAMCSYTSINGIPSCASAYLLSTVVREYWGRPDAIFTSDCDAVANMYSATHYAQNLSDAAAIAIRATMDVNDGAEYSGGALLAAIQAGEASMADVDAALARMLTLRFKMGMFDATDGQIYTSYGVEHLNNAYARALNEEAAAQGIVLLKNANNTLPLSTSKVRTIAIVGPHADYPRGLAGDFYGDWLCPGGATDYSCIPSIAAAVASVTGGTPVNILIAPGVKITGNDTSGIAQALAVVSLADTVLLCVGNDNAAVEHEGVDRTTMGLPGVQDSFARQVLAAAAKVHAPVVLIMINAGALSIDDLIANSSAIVEAMYPVFGAPQLARALFGLENRWGRMPFTTYPIAYENEIALENWAIAAAPGRTYKYYNNSAALFTFGAGLSYTTFAPLTCTGGGSGPGPSPPANYSVAIGCSVTHGAGAAGDEILLVFHRVGADVMRVINGAHPVPAYALVQFERLAVAQKSTVPVQFTLPALALALIDENGASVVYPGTHYFDVSPRSPGANFTIVVRWETAQPVVLAQPPIMPSAA